ncbi:nitrite reductase small subunit NirD [Pseudoruegeria sp. SK021]|uniref:nitrite reductase small subunit NirD n=1 Tax=Pseudoruegeria sp. SK021 TaxID=1933035 RepID=UPI000A231BDD|nr:nitrite reductase small subunit NirD [Pseudoruegeria sp. SK021]OSP56436.1 nitrite reductase (NAD(P)H) small subunit [Pseudoruegeria sp. SK021]
MTAILTDWMDIGPLDAIAPRGARVIRTSEGCIAVFRTASDEVFAVDDRCPHKGGPLSDGIVHGASVTCPLHNWVFDLSTGQAKGADAGQIATYPVRVEAGRLLIDMTMLAKRIAA